MINLRQSLLTLGAALLLQGTAMAQSARSILDQTASTLRNSGGIKAEFEATHFKGTEVAGTANGDIMVQGRKFKIATNTLTTWYDGRTQWTLVAGSDEVNVNTPTNTELQQLNPYTFVDLYKHGYSATTTAVTYRGKACNEVRLTAENSKADMKLIIVTIDKQTNLPMSIRIKDKNDQWTRIRVQGIQTRQKWNDATFQFQEKDHPGIEVVDLR